MHLTAPMRASRVLDMTLTDEQATTLGLAADIVRSAKEAYDEARAEREDAIRSIAAEGASYRDIAEYAGISYQRIFQILGEPDTRLTMKDTIEAFCPCCMAKPGEPCTGSDGRFHRMRHERRQAIHMGQIDNVVADEPTYGERPNAS